jgi:hypothetical protein
MPWILEHLRISTSYVAKNWCCATLALLSMLASWPARAAELVMYENPGCPYCLQWEKEIGVGYAKSPEGGRAPLRKQQLSDRSAASFVLRHPVTMTPTFVLVDGAHEIGRITGYVGSEFFYVLLDELLASLPDHEVIGVKQLPVH